MIHTRPWPEVKRETLAHRTRLLEELATAPLNRVREIQIEIRVIDQVIARFEAAPAEQTRVGVPADTPIY